MPVAVVSRYWLVPSAMRTPTRLDAWALPPAAAGPGMMDSMRPVPARSGWAEAGTTTMAGCCCTTTVLPAGCCCTTTGAWAGAMTIGAGAEVTLSWVAQAARKASAMGARTSFLMVFLLVKSSDDARFIPKYHRREEELPMARLLALALISLFAGTSSAAWPDKPITLIVAYSPGGGTDLVA